jgi:threonine/homoserine/homoserine lactone efflux protein
VIGQLEAFLAVSVVVIVTPGPDTALTVRNALVGGRRGGAFTALGVSTGQAVWALATGAGLAALLRASEPAFVTIRLLGAAYLLYLGVQALRSALRREDRGDKALARAPGLAPGTAFRQGLLSNLGNPKMAVFFVGLLPQFAPAGRASFAVLVALGVVFSLLTLVWLTAYSVAVANAGAVLVRPGIRRTLEAVTGAVLVALGLRLAAERA